MSKGLYIRRLRKGAICEHKSRCKEKAVDLVEVNGEVLELCEKHKKEVFGQGDIWECENCGCLSGREDDSN